MALICTVIFVLGTLTVPTTKKLALTCDCPNTLTKFMFAELPPSTVTVGKLVKVKGYGTDIVEL